jgi:formylglycine-generating enzyme
VFNLGGIRNADGSWNGAASLETVPVGNPGNATDPATDNLYGQVNYTYNIGKYEVTARQYTEFLNAVASTDDYGLYHSNMSDTIRGSGISRSGSSGSYSYSVDSSFVNRPVDHVTFWDACRFANWLENGQGGPGTTEYGTYTLTADAITTNTVTRNAGANWAVTSDDEWYKAAYYDPNLNSGIGGYWLYPTCSNTAPGRNTNDVSGNNANYYIGDVGTYPIDGTHYTTAVGQFRNSASPYGTFDEGGNVWEWNEATIDLLRGSQGGSCVLTDGDWTLESSWAEFRYPTYAGNAELIGFRVVQLPEPASLPLLAVGVMGMLAKRRGVRK